MAWLGAESGGSFPWSRKWQKEMGLDLSQVPEIIAAVLLTLITLEAYENFGLDLSQIITVGFSHYHLGLSLGVILFIVCGFVTYAGIQSATWMFLRWDDGDKDPNTERSSTTKPFVDWLAEKIGGWKLGDEGYSWTAAGVKGFIASLPFGGLGCILFPLSYEGGSHAKGRTEKYFNPHIVSEALSFIGLGIAALLFFGTSMLFNGWFN